MISSITQALGRDRNLSVAQSQAAAVAIRSVKLLTGAGTAATPAARAKLTAQIEQLLQAVTKKAFKSSVGS